MIILFFRISAVMLCQICFSYEFSVVLLSQTSHHYQLHSMFTVLQTKQCVLASMMNTNVMSKKCSLLMALALHHALNMMSEIQDLTNHNHSFPHDVMLKLQKQVFQNHVNNETIIKDTRYSILKLNLSPCVTIKAQPSPQQKL